MVPATTDTAFDIERFLQTLSTRTGVYKMLSADGGILYIGKARNLKARVSSYFRKHPDSPRIQAMVAQIADIEVTLAHNETEALLLENNLISSTSRSTTFICVTTKVIRISIYPPTMRFPGFPLTGAGARAAAVISVRIQAHRRCGRL
jgi:hypothetical protein